MRRRIGGGRYGSESWGEILSTIAGAAVVVFLWTVALIVLTVGPLVLTLWIIFEFLKHYGVI